MIDKSLLRDLVKSVIAEEVAAIRKPKAASAPTAAEERVAVATDADLIAFARRNSLSSTGACFIAFISSTTRSTTSPTASFAQPAYTVRYPASRYALMPENTEYASPRFSRMF